MSANRQYKITLPEELNEMFRDLILLEQGILAHAIRNREPKDGRLMLMTAADWYQTPEGSKTFDELQKSNPKDFMSAYESAFREWKNGRRDAGANTPELRRRFSMQRSANSLVARILQRHGPDMLTTLRKEYDDTTPTGY